MAGERFMPESIKKVYERHKSMVTLSPREKEVLELMSAGRSNNEQGLAPGISSETVKMFIKRIFMKLEVSDCTEAVVVATRRGIMKI